MAQQIPDNVYPINDSRTEEESHAGYFPSGLPTLDMSGKSFSFFEFWPSWVMYLPVIIQSLLQAIWYRSLSLPLLANPTLYLGGMVGSAKSALFSQASGRCKAALLDWFVYTRNDSPLPAQVQAIRQQMWSRGMVFPVVCKPDIGCRGNGVRRVSNDSELQVYLSAYPREANIMIQRLASWEPEAGIFYVREPGKGKGRIISLALKYLPYVIGDGVHTLDELIEQDPRAGKLKHLYINRHQHNLHKVIPKGEPYRLIFSASHCKGAIFRNGNEFVTQALTERINKIMADMREFHYGRLDIKFRDINSLQRGECIEIVEINAASSESLHIWDRNTSLFEAITTLLRQYRILYRFGDINRQRGYRPPGLKALLKGWYLERKLSRAYPSAE